MSTSLFVSRSAVSDDQTCPRYRWLRYHSGPEQKGIVPQRLNLGTSTGSLVHDLLHVVLQHAIEHDEVLSEPLFCEAVKRLREEQQHKWVEQGIEGIEDGEPLSREVRRQWYLADGLVRGWMKLRLPKILEQWRVVASEQEHVFELAPGVRFGLRMDGELKHRTLDEVAALEFKTTGWMDESYFRQWDYSAQTMLQTWVLEQAHGLPCQSVQMEFLYKGRRQRSDSDPTGYVVYSPLVRGWMVEDVGIDGAVREFHPERVKGSSAVEMFDWMEQREWIDRLTPELLAQQYHSKQVFRTGWEVERWLRQTAQREQYLVGVLEEGKGDELPGLYDTPCYNNKYRRSCEYLDLCHSKLGVEEALEQGRFVVREPHYEAEGEE